MDYLLGPGVVPISYISTKTSGRVILELKLLIIIEIDLQEDETLELL